MELNDRLITQGLSSFWSDLRRDWVGIFKSKQGMELWKSGMDGFCVFNPELWIYTYYWMRKFFFCVCVCNIKLLCHFLPDLAQVLNKSMNSKGAASKPVQGADFTQLLILRHLFNSHTQILADSQSDCEKVVEPKRNPNSTDFFWKSTFYPARD